MRLPKLMCSLAVLAATCMVARADIVTSLVGTPTQVAGGYSYTYDVELAGGQLDATNGTTTPAPLQFGTIYDFGPATFVSATSYLASDFIFSFADVNTPYAFLTTPTDNASIANVRFTYDGTTLLSARDLGTFTLISPYSMVINGGTYDGQSYKVTNNSLQGNIGQLDVPNMQSSITPEPSSLLLLGTGLLGMAGALRRRFV